MPGPQPLSHLELTLRVPAWINHRATAAGTHVAREVFLAPAYVADAVAIASLQQRFWLTATNGGQLLIPERLVLVFETKISRNDFLSTFNTNRRQSNR